MASPDGPVQYDLEAGDGEILAMAGVNLPPEPELKGPLKPIAEVTPVEAFTGFIAVVAAILSLVAMVIEGGLFVFIAGVLSIPMGMYAYYQQTMLTDIAALKETTAVMEQEVGRLQAENKRLGENVVEMSTTINDLEDVEDTLEIITNTQGQSVAVLEEQLVENKEILSTMKKNTTGRVIQNFISIIYRGDSNADSVIDEDEVERVLKGLHKIGNLEVHDDRLKLAITGKSIESVIDVVRNLMSDDIPEEEKIFEVIDEP